MKQVKVDNILYVMDTSAYTITADTDADIIYVPEDSFDAYVEVNSGLTLSKYNYNCIVVQKPYYIIEKERQEEELAKQRVKLIVDCGAYPVVKFANSTSGISKVIVDGVEQPSVINQYTFPSGQMGEHTVELELTDPTTIVNRMFYYCGAILRVEIGNKVTTIGDNAFSSSQNITSIKLPDTVTSIGESCFNGCYALENVNIPSGVTEYKASLFQYCSALTSVVISENVTKINNSCFSYCGNLESVTVLATTPPTLKLYVFENNKSGRKIYVPADSVDTYKAASNWSSYASAIEAIPSE